MKQQTTSPSIEWEIDGITPVRKATKEMCDKALEFTYGKRIEPEAVEGLKKALQRIAECEGLSLYKRDAIGFTKIAKEALASAKM